MKDTITFITGKDTYDDMYSFMLEQSKEYQKFKFYTNKIYAFNYSNKKETDTHIYWSNNHKKPMFENNTLFFKHETSEGATFDKKTGKIKIWFGKQFQRMQPNIQDDILKTLVPWYDIPGGCHQSYLDLMTKGILQKMISGKITDTESIISQFCKYNPYKIFKLDTAKLDYIFKNSSSYFNLRQFKHTFLASKFHNDVVNYLKNNIHTYYMHASDFENFSKAALSVGKEFDINWTQAELNEKREELYRTQHEIDNIYSGVLGIRKDNDLPF